jgi:hypothetical protein
MNIKGYGCRSVNLYISEVISSLTDRAGHSTHIKFIHATFKVIRIIKFSPYNMQKSVLSEDENLLNTKELPNNAAYTVIECHKTIENVKVIDCFEANFDQHIEEKTLKMIKEPSSFSTPS